MSRSRLQNNNIVFLGILATLMAVNSLSTDVYLPAMPVMSEMLGPGAELTISGYLFGFMIAQLVWGPISDRIGRIKPLLMGSVLFVIGTIGCAMATSMTSLVIWRVFQAVGACVGPMLSRAMIRDRYSVTDAADKLSLITMVMAVAPIVGPSVGGFIVTFAPWQTIFWGVAVIGVLIGIAVLALPETLPEERRRTEGVFAAFKVYGELVRDVPFMKYTLVVAFFYMAAYAIIAGTPFVYITYYGIPEIYYGSLFAANIIGLFIASFFNRRLVRRYTLDTLLRASTAVALIGAVVLLVLIGTNWLGVAGVIASIIVIFGTNGIIAACATAAALNMAGRKAGTAAALIGSLQYGSGIVSSIGLAVFSNGTPWPMGIITLVSLIICAYLAWTNKQPESVATEVEVSRTDDEMNTVSDADAVKVAVNSAR